MNPSGQNFTISWSDAKLDKFVCLHRSVSLHRRHMEVDIAGCRVTSHDLLYACSCMFIFWGGAFEAGGFSDEHSLFPRTHREETNIVLF